MPKLSKTLGQKKVWRVKSRWGQTPELKVNDTGFTAVVPVAGVVVSLSQNILQSTTGLGRIGSHIQVKRVRFAVTVNLPATITVRYILFKDTISNGTNPAVTDVLNAATVVSGYNPTYLDNGRFVILMDKLFTNCYDGAALNTTQQSHVFITNQNTRVSYIGNSGTTADNGPNSYYWLSIANGALNVTSTQDVEFQYTDV